MAHFVNQRTQSGVVLPNAVFWTETSVSRRFRCARLEKQKCLRMIARRAVCRLLGVYWGARLAFVIKDQAGALHKAESGSKFSIGQESKRKLWSKSAL